MTARTTAEGTNTASPSAAEVTTTASRATGQGTSPAARGDHVPGYRLCGLVGRGPQGRLHRADAVGQPGRPLLVEVHDTLLDTQQLEALRARCTAVAALGHPAIVPVRQVVPLEAGVALVMPVGVGGSLADALGAMGPGGLDEATIAAIRTSVTGALHRAHARGIHHGAITAEMVRFDHQGHPLLLGLGTDALRAVAHEATDPLERDLRDLDELLDTCGAGRTSSTRAVGRAPEGAPAEQPLSDAHRCVPQRRAAAFRGLAVLAAVGVLAIPLLLVTLAVTAG